MPQLPWQQIRPMPNVHQCILCKEQLKCTRRKRWLHNTFLPFRIDLCVRHGTQPEHTHESPRNTLQSIWSKQERIRLPKTQVSILQTRKSSHMQATHMIMTFKESHAPLVIEKDTYLRGRMISPSPYHTSYLTNQAYVFLPHCISLAIIFQHYVCLGLHWGLHEACWWQVDTLDCITAAKCCGRGHNAAYRIEQQSPAQCACVCKQEL